MTTVSAWAWAATFAVLAALIAVDLVLTRGAGRGLRAAAVESALWLAAVLPVSDRYAGGRLFTRTGGRPVATPLLAAVVAIAVTGAAAGSAAAASRRRDRVRGSRPPERRVPGGCPAAEPRGPVRT